MSKNWVCRLLALVLALMLAVPGFALAEDIEEVAVEQVEEAVEVEEELSLEDAVVEAPAEEAVEEIVEEAPVEEQAEAELEGLLMEAVELTEEPVEAEAEPLMEAEPAMEAAAVPEEPFILAEAAPVAQNLALDLTGNASQGLNVGDTLQLTSAEAIKSYKSSNKKVASVTSTGLVTALKAGKATITATVSKKRKFTVKVTVTDPYKPTSVSIDLSQGADFYLGMGAVQMNAVLEPSYAQSTLKWKSSNKKVAKINGSGVLTPAKAGSTKITVTTGNKKKATLKVTIHKNIVDGINAKPTAAMFSQLGTGWTIAPKSVERNAKGNYVCKFYLLNNLGKSKQINNLGLQLYVGNELVAQKTWSKIKVVSKKGSSKVFKVTYSGADITYANPLLLPTFGAANIKFVLTTDPTLTYLKRL